MPYYVYYWPRKFMKIPTVIILLDWRVKLRI